MILYHASTVCIEHPDLDHSRTNLDFGSGFYLTAIKEQAVKYAERFKRLGQDAVINKYELDDDLKGFAIKTFSAYDEDWLDFVAMNRRNENSANDFDMVEGGVANDKVFNTVDLYFAGIINKEEALGRLRFAQLNHQVCIRNKSILDNHLHFLNSQKV